MSVVGRCSQTFGLIVYVCVATLWDICLNKWTNNYKFTTPPRNFTREHIATLYMHLDNIDQWAALHIWVCMGVVTKWAR